MKIIKVKKFKIDEYNGKTQDEHYESFEEWQKKNPRVKVLDTKINALERTYIENVLLVTYEEEEEEVIRENN